MLDMTAASVARYMAPNRALHLWCICVSRFNALVQTRESHAPLGALPRYQMRQEISRSSRGRSSGRASSEHATRASRGSHRRPNGAASLPHRPQHSRCQGGAPGAKRGRTTLTAASSGPQIRLARRPQPSPYIPSGSAAGVFANGPYRQTYRTSSAVDGTWSLTRLCPS